MMNNTQSKTVGKIEALRAQLDVHNLDGFIIPKADEYQGEFVASYAERLKWLTGFTGSAGAALVLKDKACVMSDGRYKLQLKQEIDLSVFEPVDSVKTGIHGWLQEHAVEDAVIGFDPWLHTPDQIQKIRDTVKTITLKPVEENIIDILWKDQPAKPQGAVENFPQSLAGQSFADKKTIIAQSIKEQNAKAAILTLPDSISWLLNVRGNDIDYIPSVLSYAVIYADEAKSVQWILHPQKARDLDLHDDIELAGLDVIEALEGPVILDHARSPVWFQLALEKHGVEVVKAKDPCIDPKAIKTRAEHDAIVNAHIADGVAVTRFLYWLDQNRQNEKVSECAIGEKILECRAKHASFKGPSFPTIAGFGANGAVVHYRAKEGQDIEIEEGGLLLVDSGGQYFEDDIAGTTDITRTMAIGPPSEEMRKNFTLVLKGHIAVAMACFPSGTTGAQIDALARQPLWNNGLDFAHGTGHGVGCYLAVHEEAASISPRGKEPFKPGMLISNEPGYYKEGEYGIRIENLVFVKESSFKNESGEPLLEFETLSYAPIDRTLIDVALMDTDEREWLNAYHAQVYDKVSEGLEPQEREWLKEQIKPL